MAAADRIGFYDFSASRNDDDTQQQHVKIRPRDMLVFDATVTVKYYRDYFSRPRVVTSESTFSYPPIPISFEEFFGDVDGPGFLQSNLSNPSNIPYFDPEIVDKISEEIIYDVQYLFEFEGFSDHEYAEHADSEIQEFPVTLHIDLDVIQDDVTIEDDEASMQQGVTMIPASYDAIKSLETFTDSQFLEVEECSICSNKFYVDKEDEDLKSALSMPCNHVFHRQCIVRWLQTSHTCPICRYPMPTA